MNTTKQARRRRPVAKALSMRIDLIHNLDQFSRLRDDWDRVYADDPHASIHRSWPWLRGWLETTSDKWCVLAALPAEVEHHVAFLPLAFDATTNGRRVYLAGHPHADHNGFVCAPGYANEAIPRFAQFIQEKLSWDRLDLQDVADPRMGMFLDRFSAGPYHVGKSTGHPCPVITLPRTWEQYLYDCLSKRTRQNLRRRIKRLETLPDFRATSLQSQEPSLPIEVILTYWRQRWGKRRDTVDRWRAIMRRCAEADILYVHVFWIGTAPIASIAAYRDELKNTFSAFMQVYNQQYARFSPGTAINGISIRHAIEAGYLVYDFGRGGPEYKYRFGAEDQFNQCALVVRKSLRADLGVLKARTRRLCRKVVSRIRHVQE